MNHEDVVAGFEKQVAELTDQLARATAEIDQLQTALVSSRRIGAAIGIIMASLKVLEDTAFDVLRMASQNSNRKLRDVADEIVQTGTTPSPSPAGAVRGQSSVGDGR